MTSLPAQKNSTTKASSSVKESTPSDPNQAIKLDASTIVSHLSEEQRAHVQTACYSLNIVMWRHFVRPAVPPVATPHARRPQSRTWQWRTPAATRTKPELTSMDAFLIMSNKGVSPPSTPCLLLLLIQLSFCLPRFIVLFCHSLPCSYFFQIFFLW